MKLKALSLADVQKVREWRNENLTALRTPYMLNEEMQESFFKEVICNRNAKARFWGVYIEDKKFSHKIGTDETIDKFIGMVGLENIEWENSKAEISIILDPECRNNGKGKEAIRLLLEQGFYNMNLHKIFGECYFCNPAIESWKNISEKYSAKTCIKPDEKFLNNQYWDTFRFDIFKKDFISYNNKVR